MAPTAARYWNSIFPSTCGKVNGSRGDKPVSICIGPTITVLPKTTPRTNFLNRNRIGSTISDRSDICRSHDASENTGNFIMPWAVSAHFQIVHGCNGEVFMCSRTNPHRRYRGQNRLRRPPRQMPSYNPPSTAPPSTRYNSSAPSR